MKIGNDTKIILKAMDENPITALELAEKTGFSLSSIGAYLRNARKKGLVELLGARPAKRGNQWQMVSLWVKPPKITVPPPITGIDQEDRDWMAYWKAKRKQRLERRNQNAGLSATAY